MRGSLSMKYRLEIGDKFLILRSFGDSLERFCQSVVNWMTDCLSVWWQKFTWIFFRLSKVKFWGLIFQSGPGNWESTFWKTAAVKFEKVKLLPLCHRTLWSNWTAHRSWKNGFYILHWKRSGKYLLDNIFIWWFWILTYVLRRFRQVLNQFSIFFCCPRKANFNFSALFWLWVSVYFHQNTIF